jgi:tRNA A-37 threonylcarbamoyl transferase component Bud32
MINLGDKVRFGIRQKLFFLVLISFSALIVITSWRIGVEANRAATATIERTLTQSSKILRTKIQSRFASIQETAVGLARDGRVLPLIYEADSPTLQDLTSEFKKSLAFDTLFFTDRKGVVLARSDRPDAIGQELAGKSSLFDAALSGQTSQGISISQNKLLQMVVTPTFDNVAHDLVRGTVAIGYELSPEIAREINSLTASDIGFFTFTRTKESKPSGAKSSDNTNQSLIASLDLYFEQNPLAWQKIYNSKNSEIKFELMLDQGDYFAIAVPLANRDGENLGFIMALSSRTQLLEPFTTVQQQVFIVGFACILIASIIAWIIAKRISMPIVGLVSVAKDIQEGNYPDASLRKKLNDEVGLLYDAMFQMGNTLKEKAELENYLANVSDGLDLERIDLPDLLPYNDDDQNIKTPAAPHANPEDETQISDFENIQDTLVPLTTDLAVGIARPIMIAGTNIQDRYQIIRHLGAGAMADVYLAKDLDLNELIALKILDNRHFVNKDLESFKQEIRLARRITHRNILRTYDFGAWEGLNYITMEFVQGYDLARLIEKAGPLTISNGLTMAKQICSAMKAAHDQGIIHRDIKPSNMMINKHGIIKIMDFGLALAIGKESASNADNSAKDKMIAGTPNYMAPEQFLGEHLDQRTDIYALGILLYTIFTGYPPFSYAKKYEHLEELHLHTPSPKLRNARKSAPEELEAIIVKATQKKPTERYQSVGELLDALQRVQT